MAMSTREKNGNKKRGSVPAVVPVALHEAPLETGRETGAAAAAEARLFDLVEDPVGALEDNLLGLVPVALRKKRE